ncbi:MAG: TAXI family TRAP transporter solute-binding subunit [Pseudomonadota bacterium]
MEPTDMREILRAYWPFIIIALIGLLIALRFVEPAPPKRITFAVGPSGGAYEAFALRYQAILGESGVTVDLIETAGSVDNLRMVGDGDADLGLVQGGLAKPDVDENARSLGGLFLEPFWVFARTSFPAEDFGDLKSARMAIGQPGSGTRALAIQMRAEWGDGWGPNSNLALSGTLARDALISGEIDAAIYVSSVDSPLIRELLAREDIYPIPFPQASALSRRSPALAETVLLRGVLDIGDNLPEVDIPLIAPVAQIVTRRDTHPAIQAILLDSANAIHSEGSLLIPAGTFPDGKLTDLPLSREAFRWFERGPSALRRWFSFGTANFLERAWVLAIPLITLMIPMARVAPPIYRWRVRRRIYIWYSDIRELETKGRAATTDAERQSVVAKLNRLQEDVGKVDVPLSYTDDLYRLRNHIEFVESLIGKLKLENSA